MKKSRIKDIYILLIVNMEEPPCDTEERNNKGVTATFKMIKNDIQQYYNLPRIHGLFWYCWRSKKSPIEMQENHIRSSEVFFIQQKKTKNQDLQEIFKAQTWTIIKIIKNGPQILNYLGRTYTNLTST